MKGARPFNIQELVLINDYFDNEGKPYSLRDKLIIFMTIYTGRRVSEIVSLRVKDVCNDNGILADIYFQRQNLKGKKEGKICLINDALRKILEAYILEYHSLEWMKVSRDAYLFPNRNNVCIHFTRFGASNIFAKLKKVLNLQGKVSTHSGRKTFADIIYKQNGKDIAALQDALGHKNIASTVSYIKKDEEKTLEIIHNMDFGAHTNQQEKIED